jgi:hypothetical protein
MQPRLNLNSSFSCLNFLSAGVSGVQLYNHILNGKLTVGIRDLTGSISLSSMTLKS